VGAPDEIDQLLRRIRGLVQERRVLRERGAGDRVLEEHSAEIARLQWRLAQTVRRRLSGSPGAAP
jgi:hypothetical protein